MGIPGLSRDLIPYAKRAILGSSHQQSTSHLVHVSSLIIDGPSFSYHVYHKLLACQLAVIDVGPFCPVTYQDLGQAALFLLSDLANHGVGIQALYFDGALPASKIPTRLERLEHSRRRLEEFHRSKPIAPWTFTRKTNIDYGEALWTVLGSGGKRPLPPAPPFLVPAIIDALLASSWQNVLHIVPEEADVACARLAYRSGASILSNDSDMCLYDLGSEAGVVQLHSLEKAQSGCAGQNSDITAMCLWPGEVAGELRLPSLRRFAFERFNDSSGEVSSLVRKARLLLAESDSKCFDEFTADYTTTKRIQSMLQLDLLDPRVAELVAQVCDHSANVFQSFLPMLHEDPTSHAAWGYGTRYRQLAYSILNSLSRKRFAHLTEYGRKGDRVAGKAVRLLSDAEQTTEISSTRELLGPIREHASGPVSSLYWYILAIELVIKERLDQGKNVDANDIYVLFGVRGTPGSMPWSAMHLDACVQAVLYSFRILRQLTKAAIASASCTQPRLLELQKLCSSLSSLPSTGELFLDMGERRIMVEAMSLDLDAKLVPILASLPNGLQNTKKSRTSQQLIKNHRVQSQRPVPQSSKQANSAQFNVYETLSRAR